MGSPTISAIGTTTYYAEYFNGTCSSLTRTAVTLTITPAPAAPTSLGNITECEESPIQTLDANNAFGSTTGITWYTAATAGATVFSPTLSATGNITYYAEYNDGTCPSITRTPVTLTLNAAPATPISTGNIIVCETNPIQTLDANDALVSTTGVTWYDSAIGNTVVPNPTISAIGTATYYAEYNNGTCSSLTRRPVTLTINGAPAPESRGNITQCLQSPIQTLNANNALVSNTGVTWYNAAITGDIVVSPTLSDVGSITYYAEYTDGTCTSLNRTPVTLTINGASPPFPPASSGNITVCETNPIVDLDANNALVSTTGITWYNTPTGDFVIVSPTLSSIGSITYYAEYSNGACSSLTRTPVILTMNGAPAAPTSIGDITSCEANPIVPLDANDALISITGVTWYTAATDGVIVASPTLNSISSVTYYAEYNNGTCDSLTRTACYFNN